MIDSQLSTINFIGNKTDSERDFFNCNMIGFFLEKTGARKGGQILRMRRYGVFCPQAVGVWGQTDGEEEEGGRERGSREEGRGRNREREYNNS